MAGEINGVFRELVSPFLREKLEAATARGDAAVAGAIAKQYLVDPQEQHVVAAERRRHYEAEMQLEYCGQPLRGVERLYRRVLLIEPTTVCAAHCRWCLRGHYGVFSLAPEELVRIARFCGDPVNRDDLREVLVTGGDPLMVPERLRGLLEALRAHAPNIETVRIGTRVPAQEPRRINGRLLDILAPQPGRRIEIGTHLNSRHELFPEVREALVRLRDNGVVIYCQTVLLKGVNDDADELVGLFDELRRLGIETHYLFHCIPMKGISHHRTSLATGLRLIRQITGGGRISGRCKPTFAVMTDIGKITLYEGTILAREGPRVLLQSCYREEERRRWNPAWVRPESALVDDGGFLRVWYLDAAE